MEKLFNDRARLIALLELLPEQFIDDLVNDYLWNANYPQHFNLIFDKYKTKRKEILFQFSNPKIKKVFTKFNEDFDSLMNFLITNFAVPKSMHHQETNLNICYLQPRIHHNFRLSEGSEKSNAETDSIKWNEYKVELDGRATIFENSYKKLIGLAKSEIENSHPGIISKIFIFVKKRFVELLIGITITVISGLILASL